MSLFSCKPMGGGLMDAIRCDEADYLIWKWHPAGTVAGRNRRENGIRWGSTLRVRTGEVAVLVYQNEYGQPQDFFEGPCDVVLETENLPVLSRIMGLAYDGDAPFQAEVYFINLASIIQVRFGVPYFDVFDPRLADFGASVSVRGTISFKIDDYRTFAELHKLAAFSLEDFKRQIRDATTRCVKSVVADAPAAFGIPLVQMERKIAEINERVEAPLKTRLRDDFGVEASAIDIGAIELDKTSDEYRRLMAVTRELAGQAERTRAEVSLRRMRDLQRVEMDDYEKRLRIEREEDQYARRKQAQTEYLAAYQTEARTTVGVAGAEALGRMGEHGAGSVELGGGAGFNPAAMVSGMAVGGAVGQTVAAALGTAMGTPPAVAPTPPPVPMPTYHVAVRGQATGPYDLATLRRMATSSQFGADTLVWRPGMDGWARADVTDDLATLFGWVPPVPPVA